MKRKKGLYDGDSKSEQRCDRNQPFCGRIFYCRIGGTLFKVRVYTGSEYTDTLDEKISRLICGEMMTGSGNITDSPKDEPAAGKEFGMNNRTAGDSRITALYERLSRDDDLAGDGNSIVNQYDLW